MMWHLGTPVRPTEIRAFTCSYSIGGGPSTDQFITHQVSRWWGLSFGAKWFVGFMTLGETRRVDLRTPDDDAAEARA